jgi:hypothetical protein
MHALSFSQTHDLSNQAIKAYASDRLATETGKNTFCVVIDRKMTWINMHHTWTQ